MFFILYQNTLPSVAGMEKWHPPSSCRNMVRTLKKQEKLDEPTENAQK